MATEEGEEMSTEIKNITKEEFQFIFDKDQPGSIPQLHNEREWLKGNQRLGIIILDKIDNDWSYVAMAQDPDNDYRAYETATSFKSIDEARSLLIASMQGPLPKDWWL
jgi:hypothetical protein